MIANAWTWEHHKLIIASMVQVKREASHASQACSGNGSWHHPPLTWMQQCSATMHPICWNHTTSNEHECISLQVVIRFLLGPSQVVAHLMLWIPSLLSLDFRHLFLGDDRVHGVHELLLYKRCWLYSGLYFGLIVRYNFCMWITHRCIYPIPFIYMYNRNHLLHMIGFPNNFPKWDQYVQNGILVEVACLEDSQPWHPCCHSSIRREATVGHSTKFFCHVVCTYGQFWLWPHVAG